MNMSNSFFSKISFFKNFKLKAFLTFVICFGFAGPSISETITITKPEFAQGSGTYKLDSSVDCPTPSLSVGAFGGAGNNDTGIIGPPNVLSDSGNSYGISVGIQVPLGTSLGSFCEKYFKEKVEFERTRTEIQRRNSQLSLIEQCFWLKNSGFDLEQDAFNLPEFSSLRACKNLNLNRKNQAIVNPLNPKTGSTTETGVTLDRNAKPPNLDTSSPFSSSPTIIQDERRRN